MYNSTNLLRQKRAKQKEYDRKKAQHNGRGFNHDLQVLKREIDMLDQRIMKNQ